MERGPSHSGDTPVVSPGFPQHRNTYPRWGFPLTIPLTTVGQVDEDLCGAKAQKRDHVTAGVQYSQLRSAVKFRIHASPRTYYTCM